MKLKLLLTFLMLFALEGFAQAEAYLVPDINQCNNEVFDLTVNTPIVLGNQNPNEFSVDYFLTEDDAEDNVNPLQNPQVFVPNGMETIIYIRVTNMATDEYAITSFVVSWGWASVPDFVDLSTCGDPYILPNIQMGNYYTGPNGTGTMLAPGTQITTTQTIYFYSVNGQCSAETNFTVTIGSLPEVQNPTPSPLLACDAEDNDYLLVNYAGKLYEIMGGNQNQTASVHYYEADAITGTNALINPFTSQDSNPFTIYVRVNDVTTGCYTIIPVEVIEGGCTGNELSGTVNYDMNGNGCGTGDLAAAWVPVTYTSDNYFETTFTNENGEYAFYNLPDGTGTVSVQQGTMFTATPAAVPIIFAGNDGEANFCYAAANPVNDVTIIIAPYSGAQPGFATYYALYYQNNGTLPASGTITLQFDNANLVYNTSDPGMTLSGNTLTLAYSDLQPFQTGMAGVVFTVNVPQITPAGTILNFTATIDPVTGDANPADNTYELSQVVVNSWDPNDITVHEGATITPEEADEYLHYTIRFQNKGTANAVNIVIENPIDEKLDISTLEPIGASHAYTTTVIDGEVKFTFNNINLTWEDNDEMGSQGYVTYRIKPEANVTLGDYMQGGVAGIFFDFNDPVLTNTVTTTIQNTMGTGNFASEGFVIYPNPASDVLNIQLNNTEADKADMTITDVLGKTVMAGSLAVNGSNAQADVSALEKGIYFVTLTAQGKTKTEKLVIR